MISHYDRSSFVDDSVELVDLLSGVDTSRGGQRDSNRVVQSQRYISIIVSRKQGMGERACYV